MILKIAMFLLIGSMLALMVRVLASHIEASKARAKVVARRNRRVTDLRRDPATGVYHPVR